MLSPHTCAQSCLPPLYHPHCIWFQGCYLLKLQPATLKHSRSLEDGSRIDTHRPSVQVISIKFERWQSYCVLFWLASCYPNRPVRRSMRHLRWCSLQEQTPQLKRWVKSEGSSRSLESWKQRYGKNIQFQYRRGKTDCCCLYRNA